MSAANIRGVIGLMRVEAGRAAAAAQLPRQLSIVSELEGLSREAPSEVGVQNVLAENEMRLAELRRRAGSPAEALAGLVRALALLDGIARVRLDDLDIQAKQAAVYAARGRLQADTGAAGEALASARKAVELVESAAKEEPSYRFDLARYRAQCGSLVARGTKSPAGPETAEAERYYAAAIQALTEAVAGGFDQAHQLKTDPYLAPLRQREDFRTLVGEVEGRVKEAAERVR